MSMRDRKIQTEQKTRKFLTSAGFPSVWCLSGVPEGLLIAGDHQTSIQTRGKSNSPPSRSRPRQRGRRCPLLVLYCSRGPGFLSCHGTTELQQTPRPPFCIEVQVSGSKATSLSLLHAEAGLRKLRHLTKWAGAAVRMGQQGGQTEALWTHLDPSKPQERLHAPAGAHARSAATCHNHTEQEASDHLHLQLKTTFSVKTTFRKEKKRGRIIKRSALLLSMCPMNAIPRCSLGGAVFYLLVLARAMRAH